MARSARALRHLQVTGARLTVQTGPLLCNEPSMCQSLRSLLVGGTGAMTMTEAELVISSCPNLQRLFVWSQVTVEQSALLQTFASTRNPKLLVFAKARVPEMDVA